MGGRSRSRCGVDIGRVSAHPGEASTLPAPRRRRNQRVASPGSGTQAAHRCERARSAGCGITSPRSSGEAATEARFAARLAFVYLRRLTVQNVKLLRDFTVDFVRDGDVRKWTVLIGENGVCKTALLQCIALAASGPDRANQLADVPSLINVRNPSEPARIVAEFTFGGRVTAPASIRDSPLGRTGLPSSGARCASSRDGVCFGDLQSGSTPSGESGGDPLREASARGLPSWFVAGYGVARDRPAPA